MSYKCRDTARSDGLLLVVHAETNVIVVFLKLIRLPVELIEFRTSGYVDMYSTHSVPRAFGCIYVHMLLCM